MSKIGWTVSETIGIGIVNPRELNVIEGWRGIYVCALKYNYKLNIYNKDHNEFVIKAITPPNKNYNCFVRAQWKLLNGEINNI